ncbi:MAG: DinB family protein [Gemmatimonadota bacterium]|jgi:hypothetical protein
MSGGKKRSAWAETPTPALVAQGIREVFQGPAWHGPTVRSALRGVTWREASWRPAPGRNTIWDLVLHLAYVRHRMMGRVAVLTARGRSSFPRKLASSWFPELPGRCDAAAWRGDLELLEAYQERLLDTLADVDPAVLTRRRKGADRPLGAELMGVAFHDAYHAGQIKLLAKLAREALESV